MGGRRAQRVVLTERQESILRRLERADKTPQRLAERCRIVLLAAQGRKSVEIAKELGVDTERVSRWRNRWAAAGTATMISLHSER